MMDTLNQVYFELNKLELCNCKIISPDWRVCEQAFPLKLTHLHQECEARLLQPTVAIPPDCSRKIIYLAIVWLPLTHNRWIFSSSSNERVTIICNYVEPSDVVLQGTHILSMFGRCDALGASTKIQTQTSFTSNRTDKDSVPNTTLNYDCCKHLGPQLKLNEIKLISELPLKNILGHLNAFKYAGHSVDEVEKLILQNEAELNRDHRVNNLKFLSYVGMVAIVAILLLFCCCLCKKNCNTWKKCMNGDCCGKICIRQTVINHRDAKSSDEDLREGAGS
jgi:hypothetical protein